MVNEETGATIDDGKTTIIPTILIIRNVTMKHKIEILELSQIDLMINKKTRRLFS